MKIPQAQHSDFYKWEENFSPEKWKHPGPVHAPVYAWIWNARVTGTETRRQIDEMRALGIDAFYIIPEPKTFRPYTMPTELEPDYLSPAFFDEVRFALDYAAACGMHCWLYDEGGWPSGGACGEVLRRHPAYARKTLACRTVCLKKGDILKKGPADLLARDSQDRPLAFDAPAGTDETVTIYYEENILWAHPSACDFPDKLNPRATECFIDLTHEQYKRCAGGRFGDTVHMMFTDEPVSAYPTPFGRELRSDFCARTGIGETDLVKALTAKRKTPAERQQTADWFDFVSRRYCENYMAVCGNWCRRNGLLFTGHMDNDHNAAGTVTTFNTLRALRFLDVPGVDVIWRQIFPTRGTLPEGTETGGNGFFPRFAVSAAHQNGAKYTVSESFGVYGPGLTFEQMRYVTNYQLVRGITLINPMAVTYGRERYFSAGELPNFAEGFDKGLALYNRETARNAYAASVGREVLDTALYYPVADLVADGGGGPAADSFEKVSRDLEDRLVSFDLADDDVFLNADPERLARGQIAVGDAVYRTVVFSRITALKKEVAHVLAVFASSGGRVLCADGGLTLPFADGSPADLKPVLTAKGAHRGLRAQKRIAGDTTLYLVFNELPEKQTYELDFGQDVCRLNAEGGLTRENVLVLESGELAVFVSGKTGSAPKAYEEVASIEAFTLTPLRRFTLSEKGYWPETPSGGTHKVRPGDFTALLGQDYSGTVAYEATFAARPGASLRLALGKVNYVAEVFVNGQCIGTRIAPPYDFSIPPAVLKPENSLRIEVSNTAANIFIHNDYYKTLPHWFLSPYFDRETALAADSLPSGLFGPVKLLREKV